MKYYAVRKGLTPGIYTSWDECSANVTGVPGAIYKSFTTLSEAEAFIGSTSATKAGTDSGISTPYAFVDGSFNAKTGVYGFGGFLVTADNKYVLTGSGSDTEMASMRNVAGEILGSTAAIKKAIELGLPEIAVYYDYSGIEEWAEGRWKRNKTGTIEYYNFIQEAKNVIKINFVKVKGHSGVEGNEEADKLAKSAVGIK